MHPRDAQSRLLTEGELAWVYGPRRGRVTDAATGAPIEQFRVRIGFSEDVRPGDVVLRDLVGSSPSELVRVVKPDLDSRGRRPNTALA